MRERRSEVQTGAPRRAARSAIFALGPKLKAVRADRGLSLRDLAARSGFSASFLSQVERGDVSPSLASLERITDALEVDMGELLEGRRESPGSPVIHRHDESVVHSGWSRATLRLLLAASEGQPASVVLVGLDPGGRSGKSPHARSGRTFAFCVSGRATLVTAEETIELASGDSAYYEASISCLWANEGRRRTEILIVTLPV